MAKKLDKPALASNYVWFMLVTLLIFVVAFALMLGGIHGSNFQEHGALIRSSRSSSHSCPSCSCSSA